MYNGRAFMVIQCPACQTRFRLADEKIGPQGVSVRCSKCAHTFPVRREDAGNATTIVAMPAAAAAPPPSPPAPLPPISKTRVSAPMDDDAPVPISDDSGETVNKTSVSIPIPAAAAPQDDPFAITASGLDA